MRKQEKQQQAFNEVSSLNTREFSETSVFDGEKKKIVWTN